MKHMFESMEPLWQMSETNDAVENKTASGECKKAIKKLYEEIKQQHLYWDKVAAAYRS